MHIILVTALLASQAAGIAGLYLGIRNYNQAKNAHKLAVAAHQLALDAPKREDQRKYRAQLREVLFPIKRLSEDTLRTLEAGGTVVGDASEAFASAKMRVEELIPLLKSPSEPELRLLRLYIDRVQYTWREHDFEQRPTAPDTNEQRRIEDAMRRQLQKSFEELLPEIDKCVKQTIDDDNA